MAALLEALSSVYAYKNNKAKAEQKAKHSEFLKQKEKQDAERLKRLKEERKKTFRAMGQKEKKKLKSSLKGASKDNWVYFNSHLILLDCDSRPIGSGSVTLLMRQFGMRHNSILTPADVSKLV